MDGMPAAYARVEAAMQAQLDNPRLNDGLADAACTAVLDIARELGTERPQYADAFQALAERLGYC
jgi:hypothetical protein